MNVIILIPKISRSYVHVTILKEDGYSPTLSNAVSYFCGSGEQLLPQDYT
jgi:hypothetical protein